MCTQYQGKDTNNKVCQDQVEARDKLGNLEPPTTPRPTHAHDKKHIILAIERAGIANLCLITIDVFVTFVWNHETVKQYATVV
jgi:hypothetical protein